MTWVQVWLVWLACVIASFLVLEIRGYARSHTFSDMVWRFIGLRQPGGWHVRFQRILVIPGGIAFCSWLLIHFATGWM